MSTSVAMPQEILAQSIPPEVSSLPLSVPYNPPAPQSSVASAPSASLYVGELDPTVTEAMLFEIFNMIGPVARLVGFDLRIVSDLKPPPAFVSAAMR